jgi:hypothetical protein
VFWLLAAPCELWKLAFGSWAVVQGERINAFAILRAAFYSPLAMGAEFQFDVFLSWNAYQMRQSSLPKNQSRSR